ncbi:MAG: DNA polymerase [Polyangiaceae bacterium]
MLGWHQPRILDLWAEHRIETNGVTMHSNFLCALQHHGIPAPIDGTVKKAWQKLCAEGTEPQIVLNRDGILDYCEGDVLPLCELYRIMAPSIDLNTALFRGEYSAACAEIEHCGIPVEVARLQVLADRWPEVRAAAAEIATTRMRFKIYGGTTGTQFSYKRFEEYLLRVDLLDSWPRTASGRLAVDDKTLKNACARHPDLEPLRQARRTMSMIHPARIRVGGDGRCRTQVRPFASSTGRNQPRAHTPLAYPAWMRALIRPGTGRAMAILDYSQQEFALAGALSGDPQMRAAYASGDAYLAFAIQCGALPVGSQRGQPGVDAIRDCYKIASVAIMYGVSDRGLADILGIPESRAKAIMFRHRRTYPRYWEWSDEQAAGAAFDGVIETESGWRVSTSRMGDRSVRNWPVQSTGGDILRLATVTARRAGIEIVALVHDAVIVEADVSEITAVVGRTKQVMIVAGEEVAGFKLRVDNQIISPGQRYFKDDKAKAWWTAIWKRLGYLP